MEVSFGACYVRRVGVLQGGKMMFGWWQRKTVAKGEAPIKSHFVEDYERLVDALGAQGHTNDDVMSTAVGGQYEQVGEIEADVLGQFGLDHTSRLLDFGCGSGRLSTALGKRFPQLDYTGVDILPRFLDYARSKAPNHFKFVCNQTMALPFDDASFSFISCFSVFTHLLHEEIFIYMEEMHRCLEPGGKLVMSFLEFREPAHWSSLAHNIQSKRQNTQRAHLNMHVHRETLDLFCSKIGFEAATFFGGSSAPAGIRALVQSLAVTTKSPAA